MTVYPILAFDPVTYLIYALIMMAISYGIAYWTRERGDQIKPAGFNELEVPSNEQGTDPPVIFGTPARSKGMMVLWYGNYLTKKVTVHDQTVNIEYFLGVHGGLAHGNIDGVLQWWAEEICVWPTLNSPNTYAADQETVCTFYAQDIWGGRKRGGGVGGTIEILYGASDQEMNSYLRLWAGGYTDIPAFRGITSAVFRGYLGYAGYPFYWGVSPKLPMMSPVLKRTNRLHDGTSQWYIAKAVIGTTPCDLNPIHILRECFTSTSIGAGISVDDLDDTNWKAAADTLYTENIGISYRWCRYQQSMKDFVQIIYDIIDGFVYFDESTAKYKVKLIRDDYDEETLTTYDEDDFEILTFARPSPIDTPSQTIVWYTDRTSGNTAPAIEDDAAMLERQGGSTPVVHELQWPQIHNPTTAQYLAARGQKQSSAMPAGLSLACKRTMHDVLRGDVFKIEHPRLLKAGIVSMIVRVIKINRGRLEEGLMTIDVIEDVFSDATVVYTSPPDSNWTPPTEDESDVVSETVAMNIDELEISTLNESVS